MQVYLRVYKLDTMISPFVDMLQRTVCEWNHCSIQVNNIVIHFFDDYVIPRWVTVETDHKLFPNSIKWYVGEIYNLPELREFSNNLPRFSKYDRISRHVWYYTFGLWPKRNDCVDKCSAILTHLFQLPRCYTTPDKLVEIINANCRT